MLNTNLQWNRHGRISLYHPKFVASVAIHLFRPIDAELATIATDMLRISSHNIFLSANAHIWSPPRLFHAESGWEHVNDNARTRQEARTGDKGTIVGTFDKWIPSVFPNIDCWTTMRDITLEKVIAYRICCLKITMNESSNVYFIWFLMAALNLKRWSCATTDGSTHSHTKHIFFWPRGKCFKFGDVFAPQTVWLGRLNLENRRKVQLEWQRHEHTAE